MMNAYKVGDAVAVIGRYSGLRKVATVVRVSPTGKHVSVNLGREHPARFIFHPSYDRHVSDYDGYLFPIAK